MIFGTKLNIVGVGYVSAKERTDLHTAKSWAGKAFHSDSVKSVCVYDETGIARLYLKKTENGVHREER